MREKLLQIVNHYGIDKQLKYIHSEYFELDEAIINAEDYIPHIQDSFCKVNFNAKNYVEHITEEIADVMVMLKQFQYYYGIEDKDIEEIMNHKIDRQLKRIESEISENETFKS